MDVKNNIQEVIKNRGQTFIQNSFYRPDVPNFRCSFPIFSSKMKDQIIYNRKYEGYLPIYIHKSSEKKGFGVFAKQKIYSRRLVCTYNGIIGTQNSIDLSHDSTFQLGWLVFKNQPLNLNIESKSHCNVGRYLNSSNQYNDSEMNCQCKYGLMKFGQNYQIVAILFSIKDIQPGEELQWFYGHSYWTDKQQREEKLNKVQFSQQIMLPFDIYQSLNQPDSDKFEKLEKYLDGLQNPFFICQNNRILFQNLPLMPINIASITKLITALTCSTLCQVFNVNEETKIQVPNLKLFQHQTKVGLRKGQKLSIEQLFQSMFIASAGDAAETLGRYFSKRLSADENSDNSLPFLEKMRQQLSKIGMNSTIITDCRGVKDNISNCRDLMNLMWYIFKKPKFKKYFEMKTTRIETELKETVNKLVLVPTNQLQNLKLFGKTGTTRQGQSNFIGFKQYKDHTTFIGLFNMREAERWITLKKILSLYENGLKEKNL